MFFFFNETATTEIYTLSLHDALPISGGRAPPRRGRDRRGEDERSRVLVPGVHRQRSEEHTSELQSLTNLVCRLLLEKKKKQQKRRQRAHSGNANSCTPLDIQSESKLK